MLVSDRLVWVHHNSDLGTNSSWWEVLGEFSSDETTVSVAADNLTPDAFVVDSNLGVLLLVNECNALAVVPDSCLTVLASLDLDESLSLLLSSLSTSESHESALSVKSKSEIR